MHTEQARIGHFSCSDERLNRLHENAVWSWRGNSVGVPTDCPQRDERLGWTGDLAVFAPSAAYLFDVGPFLQQWLVDLALEQSHADGRVPLAAPDCLKFEAPPEGLPPMDASAIWADASVWVPWTLCTAYGDADVLRDQWTSMLAHVERVRDRLLSERGLWEGGFQFGDWLDPTAPPDHPGRSRADTGVVATAVYHRSVRLVAHAAGVLGLEEDARDADRVGRRRTSRVPAALRRRSRPRAQRLPDGVRAGPRAGPAGRAIPGGQSPATGWRSWCGRRGTTSGRASPARPSSSTHWSAPATSTDAYALLMQTECPSWLYPVTMGATTVWERWDSLLPDGSVNPGDMTSFNHYALGSVVDWLHRTVGGLAPLEPGYRRFRVAPRPGGGLTSAETQPRDTARPGAGRLDRRVRRGRDARRRGARGMCRRAGSRRGWPSTLGPGRHSLSAAVTDPPDV